MSISKEELNDLYTKQKLSTPKIAKLFDSDAWTIHNLLVKFNIPRRSISESLTKFIINESELRHQYIEQKLSIDKIAKRYNCNKHTIWQKLIKFNIPRRTQSEASYKIIIDKAELIDLYINQRLSTIDISRLFKCTHSAIRKLLIRFNIARRPRNKAIHLSKIKQWANASEKTKEYWIKAAMKGQRRKPNVPEIYIRNLLLFSTFGEWNYTGDNKIFINRFNPDFMPNNRKNKIIEYFGDYYHGNKITGRLNKEEEIRKISRFAQNGYKTLIVWEHSLKNNPIKTTKQILKFTNV